MNASTIKKLRVVFFAFLCAVYSLSFVGFAFAMNIDGTNAYAWGENIGWINFASAGGNVVVSMTGMTGYAWGENVGWISLNCSNTSSCGTVDYGVTISGSTVSGYAWGENVGWISFNCSNTSSCGTVNYGVTVDTSTGIFSGYAWGENIGWIVFNCATTSSCGTVDYKLQTTATLVTLATPTPTPAVVFIPPPPAQVPSPVVSPTVTSSPLPSASQTPVPSPTPTVSGTPLPSEMPTPTSQPPGEAPGEAPGGQPGGAPFGGVGGAAWNGVVLVVNNAAQAFDTVVNKIFTGLADPATVTATAATTTAMAVLPIAAAAAGAVAQKEVAASVFQLFQVFGIRKRAKVWGVTYDYSTKRPIPLAKIELLDSSGRVLETRYADRDGRYGFLTSPSSLHASELRVNMRVQKPGYQFPSMRSTVGTDFLVYSNVYRGGEVVLRQDALVNYNIPLDATTHRIVSAGGTVLGFLKSIGERLLSLGFYVGLVVVPLNLWFNPSTANIVIFVLFFAVNGYQLFVSHRPYGVTLDALTGKPLPYALITLNDLQGNRQGFAVSDERGRFILSGEQDKDYELIAYTPANIQPQRSVRARVRGLRRISTRAWITTNLRV